MQRILLIVTVALSGALGATATAWADDPAPGMPASCDTAHDPACLHAVIPPPTEGGDPCDAARAGDRSPARRSASKRPQRPRPPQR